MRSTTLRRHAAVALGTIVAWAATTAPLAAQPATTAATDEPLLVIGDSLCVGARDHDGNLSGVLHARGWRPEYLCKEGAPLAWGITEVRKRKTVPATVVIALGTNPGPLEDGFGRRVDEMRAELRARGATQIVWVNFSNRADGYRAKNDELLLSAIANGEHYVDWAARIRTNPAWFHRDGLHYLTEGRQAWARAIAEVTEQMPGHRPYFAREVVPSDVRPPFALPAGSDDASTASARRNTFGFAQLWCIAACSAARTTSRR